MDTHLSRRKRVAHKVTTPGVQCGVERGETRGWSVGSVKRSGVRGVLGFFFFLFEEFIFQLQLMEKCWSCRINGHS